MRTRRRAAGHPTNANATSFDGEAVAVSALLPHDRSASEEGFEDEDSQVRTSEGVYASFMLVCPL